MRDGCTISELNISDVDMDDIIRLMVGREMKGKVSKNRKNDWKRTVPSRTFMRRSESSRY